MPHSVGAKFARLSWVLPYGLDELRTHRTQSLDSLEIREARLDEHPDGSHEGCRVGEPFLACAYIRRASSIDVPCTRVCVPPALSESTDVRNPQWARRPYLSTTPHKPKSLAGCHAGNPSPASGRWRGCRSAEAQSP